MLRLDTVSTSDTRRDINYMDVAEILRGVETLTFVFILLDRNGNLLQNNIFSEKPALELVVETKRGFPNIGYVRSWYERGMKNTRKHRIVYPTTEDITRMGQCLTPRNSSLFSKSSARQNKPQCACDQAMRIVYKKSYKGTKPGSTVWIGKAFTIPKYHKVSNRVFNGTDFITIPSARQGSHDHSPICL